MGKNRIIGAIEIGSSKISTLIAQVTKEDLGLPLIQVVGVSSVDSRGIRKGQIIDIEEAVEAIIESVEGAERMAGYNLDSAYVSLGGAHVASQNSRGVVAVSNPNEEIISEDIDRVIEAASAISLPSSREIIHVIPRQYTVDGESEVRDPVGMSGIRLEVETHLITASVAAVKNLRKALNEVGVNISELVYAGIASAEATLTKTEKELGCALIDVGGGTTSVACYIDGSLSDSFVLPVGAKNVTNDLAIGLRVSLETAEKIKVALSEDERKALRKKEDEDHFDISALGVVDAKKVSRKTLTEGIIRPRLNEIFSMVRIQLEKDGVLSSIPSGAIITGGGASTIGAMESAKRMLSLPVRIGKPKGVGGLVDDIIYSSFATPIGLLLYAVKSEDTTKPLTNFSKKFKLPSSGIFQKFIGTVKDLLP